MKGSEYKKQKNGGGLKIHVAGGVERNTKLRADMRSHNVYFATLYMDVEDD